MGILDTNIRNNIFRRVGQIAASVGSGIAIKAAKEAIFSKIGENNLISAGGFLGSKTASILRNFLFTSEGEMGKFDPVWKLSSFKIPDPIFGEVGSDLKTVPDDFGGSGRPKLKFMYTVSFQYRDEMVRRLRDPRATTSFGGAGDASFGADQLGEMSFGIKSATRPNPTVNFTDVNFYNYRTKIATKVEYGTMTLMFYDDIKNTAHNIYELYLKSISPIQTQLLAYSKPPFILIKCKPV